MAEQNPFPEQRPITVGELTGLLKTVIETTFPEVAVVGEISNFVRSKPGHCYLTLKDETAQIQAVVWRGTAARTAFELKNGLSVVCRGRLELYPPHGKYQLIINSVEPVGVGALELAFRRLHEKLDREGLFAPSRKKPIPAHPRRIGLITSATGAAIRDFLNILRRRSRRTAVLIMPVAVQGAGASEEIARAIETLSAKGTDPNTPQECRLDAIVLIRGGGSMEDLWAFNEERTVRAVADSRLPMITGIGHEIDVTLSDLAADLHALTPSDAAARLIPDDSQTEERLLDTASRLERSVLGRIRTLSDRLDNLARCRVFDNPADRILGSRRMSLDLIDGRIERTGETLLERRRAELAEQAARLDALSPLAVLARGYSLTETENGELVRSAKRLAPGTRIVTRLADGSVTSRVLDSREEE